jgi:hypothetical protein
VKATSVSPTRLILVVVPLLTAVTLMSPIGASAATWSEKAAPGPKESLQSVSCMAGRCSAVGAYHGTLGKFAPIGERGGEELGTFFWESSAQSVPTPTGTTEAELVSVSCTSASACIGVGHRSYEEGGKRTETLAESWNGTKWSEQTTPRAEDSFLEGVSCTASSACTAVGRQGSKTLAERWNGTEWSIETTPNPIAEGSKLDSVSCPSAEVCVAAGQSHNGGEKKTLAEKWNGTEWVLQSTPNPEKTTGGAYFLGISCTSATACTAVGETIKSGTQTLAERWNGVAWVIQSTPGTTTARLNGVACTSATSCIAVGGNNLKTLAESWNGTEWTTQTTLNPSDSAWAELAGISCTSATVCTAVGNYRIGSAYEAQRTLVEHLVAATWSEKAAPGPKESLQSVSCMAGRCSAVGAYHGTLGKFAPIGERGGEELGTFFWESSAQSVPTPTGTTEAELVSVSCTSASACIGVGHRSYEEGGKRTETLAESWNGTKWSEQTTPRAEDSFLEGVSCTASSACTAVGRQGSKTLAERWNGTEWSIETTPNPIAEGSKLDSVSCPSAEVCVAAGQSHNGGEKKTLAEKWNGTEWVLQSTPNPEKTTGGAYFLGISCTSATACTAVGETIKSGTQTLAERWNGVAWVIQSTPGTTTARLNGVACTSATSCIAVGGNNLKTLAESWNGTEWTTQTTLNPSDSAWAELAGISCTSATVCTAVGNYRIGSAYEAQRTLVEHYS